MLFAVIRFRVAVALFISIITVTIASLQRETEMITGCGRIIRELLVPSSVRRNVTLNGKGFILPTRYWGKFGCESRGDYSGF
ncbi:hypothetical protein FPQ18DRAFT_46463 [Pyronema domesticum]|nr:hypothetical protein FPQ18DRAFT_46463 [Pyronema domesticum]